MDVSLLPDEALSHAAQNGAPGIPSWLAAAELQKRNTIRSAAPIQSPQGTVVQNVVSKALQGQGIAQGAPQPQQSGIGAGVPSQQPPQSLAKGGMVKKYNGQDDSFVTGAENMGLIPQATTISAAPVAYNPTISPDTGDINANLKTVQGAYGESPDFAGNLKNIDAQQAAGKQDYGVGKWLTDLVGNILGGKSVSPTNNFGSALAAGEDTGRKVQQQNLENASKSNAQRLQVQTQQQDRQKEIANAAFQYHTTNAQIADSQAREQLAAAQGNQRAQQEAQEQTAQLADRRSQSIQSLAKSFASPDEAMALSNLYAAKGDQKNADLYKAAADEVLKRKSAESDIAQKKALALQNNEFANQKSLKGIEHGFKMKELFPFGVPDQDPNQPVGSGGTKSITTPTGMQVQLATAAPHEMEGLKGLDPSNQFDGPAVHWIMTNDPAAKGQGFAQYNMATINRAKQIMQANGITPEERESMIQAYKSNQKTLSELALKNQNLQMSEHRIDAQLPNMTKVIGGTDYGAPVLTGPINHATALLGNFAGKRSTNEVNRDSAINPIVTEYANFMGGGNKGATDAATQHARELLPQTATPDMASAAVENLKNEMRAQSGAGNDAVSKATQRTRASNILGSIRNNNPDFGITQSDSVKSSKSVSSSQIQDIAKKNGVSEKEVEEEYKKKGWTVI